MMSAAFSNKEGCKNNTKKQGWLVMGGDLRVWVEGKKAAKNELF